MNFHRMWIATCAYLIVLQSTDGQKVLTRTIFDEFSGVVRALRRFSLNVVGSTGNDAGFRSLNQKNGKMQTRISRSEGFICDTTNGRSVEKPNSVHKLRPGDIDIIGAMGDSLTAGNGAMALNIFHVTVENRGFAFSGGGQGNWRVALTLPNILKEFNPNLYGYSLSDSISADRSSRFNTGEPGAMSRDMLHQARNFYLRMKNDPKVNMTHDWKLVTMFIGSNDFCSDICYYNEPTKTPIRNHENDFLRALRFLRDNVPRLIVNVVPPPNLSILTRFTGLPAHCRYTHLFLCPCLFGHRAKNLDLYTRIMDEWIAKDKEIVDRKEFNTKDFTVNYQPFTTKIDFPRTTNNKTDTTFLSTDCFHLSQKSHSKAANALWNNMLEPEGQKYPNWRQEFDVFKCPTKERPFIATRLNSR